MERQKTSAGQFGRLRGRILLGDVKSDPAPPEGGGIAVWRGKARIPSFEDRDALAESGSRDGHVPSRGAGENHPTDRQMEEPNVPALHQDPGADVMLTRGVATEMTANPEFLTIGQG